MIITRLPITFNRNIIVITLEIIIFEAHKMKRKIKIRIADPAGNITIIVLDHVPQSKYQEVASQLFEMKEFKAEQVGFRCGPTQMEMSGLEFCGNASRSFALMIAKEHHINGDATEIINMSGCNEKLTVEVNTNTNYTKIKMPMPKSVLMISDSPLDYLNGNYLIDLGGIVHVVLKDIKPGRECFNAIKSYIYDNYDPPALGVMFYDSSNDTLTPIVYVKDVNTTYNEGSCGSGTTATAIALSAEKSDGEFCYLLKQPAGEISSTVERANNQLIAVYIEGPVKLTEEIEVEVDY